MSDPRVQVTIDADTKRFTAGIQSAMGALRGFLSAGALAGAAKAAIDLGSKITDLAAKSQVSTKWLQEVGYAAQMAGSSIEDVSQAVLELGRSQVQALGGATGERGAFAALGISIEELRGLNPEALFDRVAAAVHDASGSAESMNAAIAVMGRSGIQLVGGMADGLGEMRQQAHELGLVLDEEALAALDQLGDNLDTLKLKFIEWTAEILKNATSLANWTNLAKLAAHAMMGMNPVAWISAFSSGGFRGVQDMWSNYVRGFSDIVDSYSAGAAAEEARAVANQRTPRGAPGDIPERRRSGGRAQAPTTDSLARIGGYIGGSGIAGADRLLNVQTSALQQLRALNRQMGTMIRQRENF